MVFNLLGMITGALVVSGIFLYYMANYGDTKRKKKYTKKFEKYKKDIKIIVIGAIIIIIISAIILFFIEFGIS